MVHNIYKIFSDEITENNPFAIDCINAGELLKDANNDNEYILKQMNQRSSKFDVGSISSINPAGNRVIVYVLKGDGNNREYKTNSGLSKFLEPLGYPLFFTRGEDGWSWKDDRKIIDIRSYLCAKICMPEKNINDEWIEVLNKTKTKMLKVNRFNIFCKLTQMYLCDMVSRLEDFQLKFVERKNSQLFGNNEIIESISVNDFLGLNDPIINNNDVVIDNNTINTNNERLNINDVDNVANMIVDETIDFVEEDCNDNDDINANIAQTFGIFDESNNIENEFDNVDELDENVNVNEDNDDNDDGPTARDKRKIFISESIHGGRIHLRNVSQNALSVVSEYGCPTCFLTLTTNSEWDEINENIFEDQDGFVRVDVTGKVFKGKLYNFIHNLKAGKYFGGRVPVYLLFVFEWQERGLPHCHLVFRLTDHPITKQQCISFIDEFIRTDFNISQFDAKYTEEENEKYVAFVKGIMTHT